MRPLLGRLKGLFLPVTLAALAAAGCGPATGTVSGKVVYNGTTLKGGSVTFTDAAGKPYMSDIGEDGTYKIEKVPAGSVKVVVDTKSLLPAPGAHSYAAPPGVQMGTQSDPAAAKRRYVAIPDKYADPQTSDLTYTVTPGSQTYDPPLK